MVYAKTLDQTANIVAVNGFADLRMFVTAISINAGLVTDVSSVESSSPIVGNGDYFHGVLIALPDGTVDFAPKNYNPSPYPLTNLNVLLFRHPIGKEWALVDQVGGNQVFYRSAQLTDERLVFQELKNNMSASERIIEKEKKGYVLVGNATYNWLTKTIEI